MWKLIAIEYSIFTFFMLASSFKYLLNENYKKEAYIRKQDEVISVIYKQYEAQKTINEVKVAEAPEYENCEVMRATAYCDCVKCCGKWATANGGGITASGTRVKEGRTIAVYKKQIPLGTEVHIEGMGTYIAEDTGSAIKENCIDIYFDSHEEALKFGVKYLEVKW